MTVDYPSPVPTTIRRTLRDPLGRVVSCEIGFYSTHVSNSLRHETHYPPGRNNAEGEGKWIFLVEVDQTETEIRVRVVLAEDGSWGPSFSQRKIQVLDQMDLSLCLLRYTRVLATTERVSGTIFFFFFCLSDLRDLKGDNKFRLVFGLYEEIATLLHCAIHLLFFTFVL